MFDSTKGRGKGQWWPLGNDSATFYCLNCGHPMSLEAHQVQSDGAISPSVVCPHPIYITDPEGRREDARTPSIDCRRCDFHNYVRLIGWNEPKAPDHD